MWGGEVKGRGINWYMKFEERCKTSSHLSWDLKDKRNMPDPKLEKGFLGREYPGRLSLRIRISLLRFIVTDSKQTHTRANSIR